MRRYLKLKLLDVPVLFLLIGCGAASCLNRLVDPDLFWHLRGGRDILQAKWPVLPDTWTILFQGQPWVNQQWFTEILMALAWFADGYSGLLLLKGLAVAATVASLWAAMAQRSEEVRLLGAAAFLSADFYFLLFRTHLASLLWMAVLLWILNSFPPGASRTKALGILFVLWANTHTLFILGLVVLGTYSATEILSAVAAARRDGKGPPWSELRHSSAALFVATAATLINPFGWGVWRTVVVAASDPATRLVTEWAPLWDLPMGINLPFYLVAVSFLGLLLAFPRRVHWPSAVAALALLFFAVSSVRFTSDFTLPAVVASSGPLDALLSKIAVKHREALRGLMGALASTAATAVFVAALALNVTQPLQTPGTFATFHQPLDYPVGAVRFMKAHALSGKIFNRYSWGGYLSLELPESQVFIDPRTGVLLFPRGYLADWKEAVDLGPRWRDILMRGHPDFVLLETEGYLSTQLAAEPEWRQLYRDRTAVLYGRAPATGNPEH